MLEGYDPRLVQRAALSILGAREDGALWTLQTVLEHMREEKFDFSQRQRFEIDFLRFVADEQRSEASARAKFESDPLLLAHERLTSAEKNLREARAPLADMVRKLAEHDERVIAPLEKRRKALKTKPLGWLECANELNLARIERERLAFLIAEQQAEIDTYTSFFAQAKTSLEAAKQQAATQQQAADTAAA